LTEKTAVYNFQNVRHTSVPKLLSIFLLLFFFAAQPSSLSIYSEAASPSESSAPSEAESISEHVLHARQNRSLGVTLNKKIRKLLALYSSVHLTIADASPLDSSHSLLRTQAFGHGQGFPLLV